MKNKMAALLGTFFSTNEKIVSQCDDEALGSTAETLVIQFDQKKFEQFHYEDGSSPINMRKHMKISVAKSPLAEAQKQVPDRMKRPIYWPNSVRTKLASQQYPHAVRKTKSTSKAL